MEQAIRRCPGCRRELETIRRRDLALDVCRECGGVWFDAGEAGKLQHQHAGAFEFLARSLEPRGGTPPLAAGASECPQCGVPLQEGTVPGHPIVALERCGLCGGVWLDHAALESLGALNPGHHPPGAFPCTRCGARMLPGDDVCLECGETAERPAGAPAPPEAPAMPSAGLAPGGPARAPSAGAYDDLPPGLIGELQAIQHEADVREWRQSYGFGRRGRPRLPLVVQGWLLVGLGSLGGYRFVRSALTHQAVTMRTRFGHTYLLEPGSPEWQAHLWLPLGMLAVGVILVVIHYRGDRTS